MAIMDLSTDLVFCFDIFAQFHTAVWELVPGTAQHWEFFDDLSTVRWRYFRGDFKWDALGQIPWQYFDCILRDFLSSSRCCACFASQIVPFTALVKTHQTPRGVWRNLPCRSDPPKLLVILFVLRTGCAACGLGRVP